jgi:hypothetical protein
MPMFSDPKVFFDALQVVACCIAGALLFLFLISLAGGNRKKKREKEKPKQPLNDGRAFH